MRCMLLCAVLVSGCATTLRVTSTPPGARVLVDGQDTGEVTPTKLNSWEVGGGAISVEGAEPRAASTKVSVKAIIGSLLIWPLVLPNIVRGFRDVEPAEMHFDLAGKDDTKHEKLDQ